MLNRDTLIDEAASYKNDAKKRFDAALAALLALAWRYKDKIQGEFSFSANPDLYDEALRICREMSDGCAEDARKRLFEAIEDSLDYADEDVAWEYAEDLDGEPLMDRLDMAGSHLLDLLNLWIAVALAKGFTQHYTRIVIVRYLNNPFASGYFGAWGKGVLKWGSGYSKNIWEQLSIIGQNAIISGARYAEWVDAQAKGATYYVRRRGSNYDCPDCDALCGYPIPIDEPFDYIHSRCCCYPEYFYEPMEII